ncbi:MAG: BsuBI/PstI family type II restriction endonuclease [Chthoniobacteraceae bacterium]
MKLKLHDRIIKTVVNRFRQHFSPRGRILLINEGGPELAYISCLELGHCCPSLPTHDELPNVIIHNRKQQMLFLIDSAGIRGQMDAIRYEALQKVFKGCDPGLVYVVAFQSRMDLCSKDLNFAWGTCAWFADEPDHLIHFNGGRFLGPYSDDLMKC